MEQVYGRLLIFDGSHALHRNLCEPHLWEMKNSKGERTGGIFGVLNTLLKECQLYNYAPVVVFDGRLSKRRLDIYPNYKHHLDKQMLLENNQVLTEAEIFQQEQREEYNRQREILKPLLQSFGIPVLHFDNWEGDDIIYILSKLCKDSIVVSDDKDLLQLIRDDESGKCRVKRGMRDEFVDIKYFTENNSSVNEFIACKAIVGDQSDNIPSSCFQVGEKTAQGLYKLYTESIRKVGGFPKNEEELDKMCKEIGISKRKAYLNFDENQFLTNVLLMDLGFVETQDLKDDMETINDIVANIDRDMQRTDIETIKEILTECEIKTFIINNLLDSVKSTRKYFNIMSTDEIDIDIKPKKFGKLF